MSILRNTVFNLSGMVIPGLIALVAIPVTAHHYGAAQFGILSLCISLLAVFISFDLGIGLATTRYVAVTLRDGKPGEIPSLVWSSLMMNFTIGAALSAAVWMLLPSLIHMYGKIPAQLEAETVLSFRILSLSIPCISMASSARSVLEASEHFGLMNAVKIPAASLLFLLPMIGAFAGWSISQIALALLLSRLLMLAMYLFFACRLFPDIARSIRPDRAQSVRLLKFGGWVSVSNLINPVIAQGEKFLIPAALGVTALAYYSAPYEMASRFPVISFSLTVTLFPKMSKARLDESAYISERLIQRPLRFMLLIFLPLSLGMTLFAPELLMLWLKGDYAEKAAVLSQVLVVGFFFNALAYVPWTAVQGLGRPDLMAKLDAISLFLFLGTAYTLIRVIGLEGAAIAKAGIMCMNCLALLAFTRHILRVPWKTMFPAPYMVLGSISVLFIGVSLLHIWTLPFKIAFYLAASAVFLFVYDRHFRKEDLTLIRNLPSLLFRREQHAT